MNKPPNKSQGRSVMTSDFVESLGGVVRYHDEVWDEIKEDEDIKKEIFKHGEERARRAGAILDTSRDGYYTTEKAIPDFVKVRIYCQNPNSTKNSIELNLRLDYILHSTFYRLQVDIN